VRGILKLEGVGLSRVAPESMVNLYKKELVGKGGLKNILIYFGTNSKCWRKLKEWELKE
jgi:hypothetical protein